MTKLAQSPDSIVSHTREAISLLEAGVPLTLVLDLALAVDSQAVYDAEPGSADWLTAVHSVKAMP
jgi:hypothetical protein